MSTEQEKSAQTRSEEKRLFTVDASSTHTARLSALTVQRAKSVLTRFDAGDTHVRDGGMTERRARAIRSMLNRRYVSRGEQDCLWTWLDTAERPYGCAP